MVKKDVDINVYLREFGARKLRGELESLQKSIAAVQAVARELHVPIKIAKDAFDAAGISTKDLTIKGQNYAEISEKTKAMTADLASRFQGFGDVMAMDRDLFIGFIRQGYTFQGLGAGIATRLRLMTHGLHGFRMELLSTMFYGMQMQSLGMSMLGPAMKLYGITDLIGQVLAVVMSPVMQAILPILLEIAMWLIGLPDWAKSLIGLAAIFLVIMGVLLAVGSQVGLFIGAIIGAAGALGVFGAVANIIIIVIGVIIGIVAFLYLAWENNWFGIRDIVASVVEFLSGIYDNFIEPAFGPIIGIAEAVAAGVTGAFQGLADSVSDIMDIIETILSTFGYFLFDFPGDFIEDPLQAIADLFSVLKDSIDDILNNLCDIITNVWDGILSATSDAWDDIVDAVSAPVRKIVDDITWLWDQVNWIIEGIGSFFTGMVGGKYEITAPKIPPTQHGGIVTRPSVRLVGEAGPEAIIPLHRYPELTSKTININLSPTYNISGVASLDDVRDIIEEANSKLIDDLKATLRI